MCDFSYFVSNCSELNCVFASRLNACPGRFVSSTCPISSCCSSNFAGPPPSQLGRESATDSIRHVTGNCGPTESEGAGRASTNSALPMSDPGSGESNPGQRESYPIRGDNPGKYESSEATRDMRSARPARAVCGTVVTLFPRSRDGVLASPTMRCYPRSRCHLYLDVPVRPIHYVIVT